MRKNLMIQPRVALPVGQLLLALLVAILLFVPSWPVAAAIPAAVRDNGATGAVLEPGDAAKPFVASAQQPRLQPLSSDPTIAPQITTPQTSAVTRPTTALLTTTVGSETTMSTTVVSEITTSTTATLPDLVPANDAFAAWNNRPAVTRADSYPVRIQIPALQVDTFVEQIGERADGSMATPTNPSHVAWYSYGAIPGENGNVVMAGHFDRVDGLPAVFWDLAKLQAGDAVIVYDSTQTAYHYVVSDQQSYPYNKAPLAEIFGFDLVSRLNLITCRGNWDRNRQTYSQRLVVYTELEKIVPEPNRVNR